MAWLRDEAAKVEAQRAVRRVEIARVLAARDALDEAADQIEQGDHTVEVKQA